MDKAIHSRQSEEYGKKHCHNVAMLLLGKQNNRRVYTNFEIAKRQRDNWKQPSKIRFIQEEIIVSKRGKKSEKAWK